MKTIRFFVTVITVAVLSGAFCGCVDLDDPELLNPTSYALAFYEVKKFPGRDRAEEMEIALETFEGKTIWINRHSRFSSKDFSDVELVPVPEDPDFCRLKVKLSRLGKREWTQLAGHSRGREIAMTIDGEHYANFVMPERMFDSLDGDWIEINVNVDRVTAENIKKYASKNYNHFNPSPISLW